MPPTPGSAPLLFMLFCHFQNPPWTPEVRQLGGLAFLIQRSPAEHMRAVECTRLQAARLRGGVESPGWLQHGVSPPTHWGRRVVPIWSQGKEAAIHAGLRVWCEHAFPALGSMPRSSFAGLCGSSTFSFKKKSQTAAQTHCPRLTVPSPALCSNGTGRSLCALASMCKDRYSISAGPPGRRWCLTPRMARDREHPCASLTWVRAPRCNVPRAIF